MSTSKHLHDVILDKVAQLLITYKPNLGRAVGTLPPGNTTPPSQMPGGGYTPADGSVTGPKIAPGAVAVSHLDFDPATQSELNTHAATRGDSDFGHVKPDGTTILSAGGVLSVSGSAIGSTTLLGLSDVPDSYSGQALKPLRVKADATGIEFAASTPPTVPMLLVTPGSGGSRTWFGMPLDETEIFSGDQHEMIIDLSAYTQAQIQGRFGGGLAGTMMLRAKYSLDDGATWAALDGATGPEVAMSPTTATATSNIRAGSWVTIAVAARTTVLLSIFGQGGTGAANPTIGQVMLLVR